MNFGEQSHLFSKGFPKTNAKLILQTRATPNLIEKCSSATAPAWEQGQYLAFIHAYTRLHRRPPAEADMQQYFGVSPPSVHHQMVLTLERAGFTARQPGVPRSIEMLVDPQHLPTLR